MFHPAILRTSQGILAAFGCLGLAVAANGQQISDQIVRASTSTTIAVPIYRSRIVELSAPAKRVSVGNPDIADVLILRSNELYILGKDLGTTNVLLWDKNDALISAVTVSVTHDLEGLKRQLGALLAGERIEVYSAQRNVVLAGQVSSAVKMAAAVQLAESYLEQAATAKEKIFFEAEKGGAAGAERKSGEVINLMSVGGAQQVMLEVKVAELQRTEVKKLDTQFNGIWNSGEKWIVGGVNGGATFPDALFEPDDVRIPVFGTGTPIGPVIDEFMPNAPAISDTGLFTSFLSSEFLANLVIDAAKEKGLAKILAEPTLTTLTGQEAQFLSGGRFPIPVPQQNNSITVEFEDFGVRLRFLPVILDSGRINLKLNISVSELAPQNSLTVASTGSSTAFFVPSLTERRAVSTVELADGQTIGIAGLMNENLREVVNKFPGLGDIPVLGALFRSQSFQKGETELVILVTPKLAKPLGPGEIRLPTDNFVEPTDTEFYILGRMEGRKAKAASAEAAQTSASTSSSPSTATPPAGGAEGTFGHNVR